MKYRKVKKPWGEFELFALNEKCTVKILTLNPRQKLSLQSHTQRDELWVALDPGLEAVVGRKKIKLKVGQRVFIRRGLKHRLHSLNRKRKVRVLELVYDKFDEKYITRYEDI